MRGLHLQGYLRVNVKGGLEGKREKWVIGKGVWGFTTKNNLPESSRNETKQKGQR